jgi:hypothetical protein
MAVAARCKSRVIHWVTTSPSVTDGQDTFSGSKVAGMLVRVFNIKQLLRPTDIQARLFDIPWLAGPSAYLVGARDGL